MSLRLNCSTSTSMSPPPHTHTHTQPPFELCFLSSHLQVFASFPSCLIMACMQSPIALSFFCLLTILLENAWMDFHEIYRIYWVRYKEQSEKLGVGVGVGVCLTHWGRDKMDTISQTIFSNAFSWMKIFEFWLKFHWSLFLRGSS